MASGGFSGGFSSGFRHAATTAPVSRPTFIPAPPRPAVVELAVDFVLMTDMSATVTADDEAIVLAMLGLPGGDDEASLLLSALFGRRLPSQ